MKTTAIKLKTAAETAVKKGHPWIFEGAITKQSGNPISGDIAIIFDNRNNRFLAIGLYDADSPIRIKVLQVGEPAKLTKAWFASRIASALQLRAPLLQTDTNSFRLINGENDGFPSLIVDVYDAVLVLKLYSAIWIPYLQLIQETLMELEMAQSLVIRLARSLSSNTALTFQDGQVLQGSFVEGADVIFREHGLRFYANPSKGHKTGYFLDHRHNRKRCGELAKGKTVLDVFSYAGGFSVHTLAGGAKEVTSIDISAHALELARKNAELNPHKGTHKLVVGDAFDLLQQYLNQGQQFDMVIIDPPSFAKQKSEAARALASYKRLARLGAMLVKKPGLLVLASCSSRVTSEAFYDINEQALHQTGLGHRLLQTTFHDIDHPIGFPEGAYLKCGYYRIG